MNRQIATSDVLKRINVCNYGAKGDGTTDDSSAIASAAAAAVASFNSSPAALYFPSGRYVYKTGLPTWKVPLSIIGDGHLKSSISVDPSFAGDVFSWSEVWYGNSAPLGGN